MKTSASFLFGIVLILLLGTPQCSKDKDVNFFTVQQDLEFGQQLKQEIADNPTEYPLLNENEYPDAYTHLRRIRDNIIASDEFLYKEEFAWEVRIIHDDDVLNAFCAPGGYMYYYTGIIKFLDNEAQLAGVMAHEMAHADHRHSTENLTKQYGFSILLSALLGDNPSVIAEIAAGLAQGLSSLAFSRKNEYEADEYAVKYLYDTEYHPKGISGFFEKLDTSPTTPEFLSTHPHPENRLEEIDKVWQELGAKTGDTFEQRYQEFKNSLPQ